MTDSHIPPIVLDLVERFDRSRTAYLNPSYNETQVRREFIDPFFKALGWDVDNSAGNAPQYREVVHEDAIKVGIETRAPDYSFRIGPQRKFFVEAKKPAVNLKDDPAPAYQLRRYAWSAKLPLSIVTDFQEFAVYDCRVKPANTDKASVARTLYVPCEHYDERWEEIAAVFSREALLKGSFDQYAESMKVKKGTTEVDAAFLKEIEGWRDALARNIALRNPSLTQRELNYAVQATIDRIIFLRICEDRLIEPYGRLQGLLNGQNVYARLKELLYEADHRYNSGLFHFEHEKGRADAPDTLTLELVIDDKVLKDILKCLYYPDSPYEFGVLPADILGQVYEQFLGKVIRLTAGHQAKVEDKPEVKKAGGVYYTPTYIVDYIVKNTVGRLLEGLTPKQAASLRILDPACGSGSFLIGVYQYLLDWHRDRYVEDGLEKHKKAKCICEGRLGECRLTTAERKRILLNNIYGVDIDAQAVETTKLSLLLKVLEGETSESLSAQMSFLHERALPDLSANIKCGNSLIGPDFYDHEQLGMLDEEERYRVNAFEWKQEFPKAMEAGGFDCVIGNPPYGRYPYERDKDYLAARHAHQNYQLDSYLLFMEASLTTQLRRDGLFGMIIPNPWLTNLLQKSMRRFVIQTTCIEQIVHFTFRVFPKATVDTEIVILKNQRPISTHTAFVQVVESIDELSAPPDNSAAKHIRHNQAKWLGLDGGTVNIFTSGEEEALAKRCLAHAVPLEELFEINVGIKPYQKGKGKPPQTPATVAARPFDSNTPVTKQHRAYLRGADINRYVIAPTERRYIKYGPWLAESRPAANFDAPMKIVMRQTGDSLIAAMDVRQYLCLNNMHVLVPRSNHPSLKYVLGVVNSRLLNWYYHSLNPEVGEALAEVKKGNVAKLPVRTITFSDSADRSRHDRMVSLVESMLVLQEQLAAARLEAERSVVRRQIDAIDREMDARVYELYDLTEDEIVLVESSFGKA
jgi:type I restriction-modification system DNA methylase subunit/predicted type IV restriction endonuclease